MRKNTAVRMVPQPHGGMLLSGGKRGHVGGTGRPRDEVRAKLTEISRGKGIEFLDMLMDGKVFVRLVGTCSHCGKDGSPPTDDDSKHFMEHVSASVDQRLKGLDILLKYGVNGREDAEGDITRHPEVRRFLSAFHTALAEETPPKVANRVRSRVESLLSSS